MQRKALSIREFGAAYSVSRSRVYVEIAAGRLKTVKLGRRTLIAAEEADRWFLALEVATNLPTKA